MVFRTAEGTKLAAAMLGRGVAFEVDGYDAEAGEAWSVVVKGYAIEIEQMHDYFDALDLPLFPGTPGRSTGSCASTPSRSPGRRFHVVGPRPPSERAGDGTKAGDHEDSDPERPIDAARRPWHACPTRWGRGPRLDRLERDVRATASAVTAGRSSSSASPCGLLFAEIIAIGLAMQDDGDGGRPPVPPDEGRRRPHRVRHRPVGRRASRPTARSPSRNTGTMAHNLGVRGTDLDHADIAAGETADARPQPASSPAPTSCTARSPATPSPA